MKARGQRDLITVIGHAAAIGAGEFVQANGRWVNDRTHGVQFRADFLRGATTTAERIEKYLASWHDQGHRPDLCQEAGQSLPRQVFDVIEQKLERLKEVVETVEAGLPHSHERIRIQPDRRNVIHAEPFQAWVSDMAKHGITLFNTIR